MKKDRKTVMRLAAQARIPGNGAPGTARPVEAEVEVAEVEAALMGVFPPELEVVVDAGSPNAPPVPVPTVVNTRAPVLVAGG